MALSTSSSDANARIGTRRWGIVFRNGCLICLVLLVAWELTLRGLGMTPKIRDTFGLWASEFFEVLDAGEDGIAVIGASRIMQAIDPDVLREELPGRAPAQLGSAGASPVPVLEYLAEETDFRGTVIVDVTPRIFYAGGEEQVKYIDDWLTEFRNARQRRKALSIPLADSFEQAISLSLEDHLATASGRLTPISLARHIVKGTWPEPTFWRITADRQQQMDYTGVDTGAFLASRRDLTAGALPLTAEEFAARLEHVRNLTDQIIARGGTVIFVRLPSKSLVHEEELQRFPRDRYWQRVENELPGLKINCDLIPELTDDFTCTDGAHIDSEQTAEFTRRLVARASARAAL